MYDEYVLDHLARRRSDQIGDAAAVRVEAKSGSMVKLAFFTELPLRMPVDGIIPPRYVYGISGEPRRTVQPDNGFGDGAVSRRSGA